MTSSGLVPDSGTLRDKGDVGHTAPRVNHGLRNAVYFGRKRSNLSHQVLLSFRSRHTGHYAPSDPEEKAQSVQVMLRARL